LFLIFTVNCRFVWQNLHFYVINFARIQINFKLKTLIRSLVFHFNHRPVVALFISKLLISSVECFMTISMNAKKEKSARNVKINVVVSWILYYFQLFYIPLSFCDWHEAFEKITKQFGSNVIFPSLIFSDCAFCRKISTKWINIECLWVVDCWTEIR
jgi:hypothetical protein